MSIRAIVGFPFCALLGTLMLPSPACATTIRATFAVDDGSIYDSFHGPFALDWIDIFFSATCATNVDFSDSSRAGKTLVSNAPHVDDILFRLTADSNSYVLSASVFSYRPANGVLLRVGIGDIQYVDSGGTYFYGEGNWTVDDVPIPATLPLPAAGLGGLVLLRRRRDTN